MVIPRFGEMLVLGERARLDQELVDQRRLAVVDVSDDRDVAERTDGGRHDLGSAMPKPRPPAAVENHKL